MHRADPDAAHAVARAARLIITYMSSCSNGFHLSVDTGTQVGRRVSIRALPESQGYTFGERDIEDLINILEDETAPDLEDLDLECIA